MENATERAESGSERKGTPGPFPEAFLALLPVLACFLGGATQKWGEGIVVALLGIYLLARPPRFSLGLASNLVLLALVLLAGTAFLPANWFYQPNWRATYINDFGIALPNTLSLQPWHYRARGNLHFILAGEDRAALLAQRTQLRPVSESQSNRKPFWPDRDHHFGLRPGRHSQRPQTLDCLGRGARAHGRCNHFEFFTRRDWHSRRRQCALARRFLASPTFSLANRARRFIFAASAYCSIAFWRANTRTISSSQSRRRRHLQRFPLADLFRRLSAYSRFALGRNRSWQF